MLLQVARLNEFTTLSAEDFFRFFPMGGVAPPTSPPISPGPDSPDACTYTIKAGDTLDAVASTHETTVEAITALNPGILPTNLQIGQVGWLVAGIFPFRTC